MPKMLATLHILMLRIHHGSQKTACSCVAQTNLAFSAQNRVRLAQPICIFGVSYTTEANGCIPSGTLLALKDRCRLTGMVASESAESCDSETSTHLQISTKKSTKDSFPPN